MDELPEHLKDWIYLGEDKGLLPEDFAVWLVDKATLLQANQENPTHNHQTLEQQVENAYHLGRVCKLPIVLKYPPPGPSNA